MKAVEFIQASVQGLHQTLIEDMKELTQEQLAWRPQPGANPIGAIFLHYIRTEDAFVQRMRGLPPLWDAVKWDEKSGIALPSFRLSPGEEEADMAASLPLAESLVYARQVMDSTRTFMETLDDDKLDVVPDPDKPRRTIAVNFRAFILGHGWWHLGEIKYIKGLQGMPAPV